MICRYRISGTIVDNVFIDRLMPDAPGEYLKVYLYLLRHQPEMPGISAIADALDHTEADVRRALRYWEQAGALVGDDRQQPAGESPGQAGNRQQEPEAKGVRLAGQCRRQEAVSGGQRRRRMVSGPGAVSGEHRRLRTGAGQYRRHPGSAGSMGRRPEDRHPGSRSLRCTARSR